MTNKWLILLLLILIGGVTFLMIPYPKKGEEGMPHANKKTVVVSEKTSEEVNNTAVSTDEEIPESTIALKTPTFLETLEILNSILPQIPADYRDSSLEDRLDALHVRKGDHIFIRIFKEESVLEVWIKTDKAFELLKTYPICAYSGDLGPKLKEGDGQAPEGFYKVDKRALNPNSKFHLAFNLGFPNEYDRANGRSGSFLMVHGNCVSVGCYAMTDERIEEIYALVEAALDKGETYVPVHIFPFRMTQSNLMAYQDNQWFEFWSNLQEGYDYFETEKCPPEVEVNDKRYTILEGIL